MLYSFIPQFVLHNPHLDHTSVVPGATVPQNALFLLPGKQGSKRITKFNQVKEINSKI